MQYSFIGMIFVAIIYVIILWYQWYLQEQLICLLLLYLNIHKYNYKSCICLLLATMLGCDAQVHSVAKYACSIIAHFKIVYQYHKPCAATVMTYMKKEGCSFIYIWKECLLRDKVMETISLICPKWYFSAQEIGRASCRERVWHSV